MVAAVLWFMAPSTRAQVAASEGLVLWLAADMGVAATTEGLVAGWVDQSPNLNDALQNDTSLAPTLIQNAVGGMPAIRFDGLNSYLEIANASSLQPQTGDWTVIFVAQRLGASQGDFPEVIGSRPWTAGADQGWAVSFDSAGLVCSHYADGAVGHDVPGVRSTSPLSSTNFQVWLVEENRGAGTTAFYRNGDADLVVSSEMPAGSINQTDPVRIGREIGGANSRRANMDLAEVLVYNRVLSKAERDSVTTYLGIKYGMPFAANKPPTVQLSSPADGASAPAPATITLAATAADPDGTIKQVEFFVGAQRVATATQPPYTVSLQIHNPGVLTLTAAATDNRNERVVSAPVTFTVSGTVTPTLTVSNSLQLWLAADTGVASDANGLVSAWADQSPNLNDATQPDTGVEPTLVPDALNQKPVVRFDGANSYLEIANSLSLQPQNGDWTVFFVGERRSGSQGDWPEIIGSRPWVAGLDKGWAVVFSDSGVVSSHFADGTTGHDVNTAGVPAASALAMNGFQIWQVEENRAAATTAYYVGGLLDRSGTTTMPSGPIDQADPIRLGREIGGSNNRRASMDLAEVLVYSAALSPEDRDAVTAYLSVKYGLPVVASLNVPPTVSLSFPADGQNFIVPTNLTLTAEAADTDGTVASVQFFRGGTLLGTVTQAPYRWNVTNANPGTIVYTAAATDNLGAVGTSAAITITNITLNPPVPADIDTAHGLVSEVDYEDTFTVGTATRTDGLYNNNATGGYLVETTHGNPTVAWTPFNNFSFNSGLGSTCCGYPTNDGNDGAATGVAQSGGNDFSVAYGMRDSYVVQVDAILPPDRLDISSMPAPGATIFAANSLTVFFRRDTVTTAPGIGLFNGHAEADTGVKTGVSDNNWHNYAVHFDRPNNRLGLFVDGVLLTNLDLASFASGAYIDYANAAVGLGGTFVFWADNFRVGAAGRRVKSIDFRDTFTVGAAPRTDGLYNDNSAGGYNVESDPSRVWKPFNNFSFNSGENSTCCGYPGNTGNSGAATGLAQSGGGDFTFEYGTRQDYVVEVDAVLPADRFDVSSMSSVGAGLGTANSLSVFFRKDGTPNPGIGLFNGKAEADTGATTGVTDSNWHRYSVHFDKVHNRLGLYVDGVLKANLDLATFQGGAYANYANAAVGIGGGGGVFWADNFVVGPPEASLVPGPLAIQRTGASVIVSWTSPGTLQSADQVDGPWTPISDALSPYTTPAASAKFYRLVQ
jgi:hypothetical protein